jgi:hypothetical protein
MWTLRLLLYAGVALGFLSTGVESTARGDRSVPLSAKIVFPSKTAHSGAQALVRVELQNVSATSRAVAFDGKPSSYWFVTQLGETLTSTGWIESVTTDQPDDEDRCPGKIPTFLLSPHQSIVQLIQIPIPREAKGQLKLHATFAVRIVTDPPNCGSAVDIPATSDLPVRIVEDKSPSDSRRPEGRTK